jgi:hypothetical protein
MKMLRISLLLHHVLVEVRHDVLYTVYSIIASIDMVGMVGFSKYGERCDMAGHGNDVLREEIYSYSI